MKIRKKIMILVYPFMMKILNLTGIGTRIYKNKKNVPFKESFYSLKAILNTGEEIQFDQYKNRKVLIVNVASECGFTPQYAELENLHKNDEMLTIISFPSDNFGGQEPENDAEINNFYKINYGVTFPVFKKNDVKGNSKQPVYEWLTNRNKNGWNDMEPQWNFYKYLVDENGNLSKIFSSSVSPMEIKF